MKKYLVILSVVMIVLLLLPCAAFSQEPAPTLEVKIEYSPGPGGHSPVTPSPTGEYSDRSDRSPADEERTEDSSGEKDMVRIFSSGTLQEWEEAGDVVLLFSDGAIRGKVKGDCVCIGGRLSIKNSAEIEGDLVTLLCTLDKSKEAHVKGDEVTIASWDPGFIKSIFMAWDFILALLIALFFWKHVHIFTDRFLMNPASGFLTGFLGLLSFVPLILLLVVSIAGILIIPLVPLFYFFGFALGFAVIGNLIGERIARLMGRDIQQPLRIVLGLLAILLIVKLVALFPLLGGLTAELLKMIIRTFGLGLLFIVVWEAARKKRK